MPLKTKEENRKSELTSIIDVVFLLLIFFLVTLSIAPKTTEQGESIRVIERQITQPKDPSMESRGVKQKVNAIIQVLDRANSTQKYVLIDGNNFNLVLPVVRNKKNSNWGDDNNAFINQISQGPPFGPAALYDINQLSSKIKPGDRVSIRAPEMISYEQLIALYDLILSKKAAAFWSLGPLEELHSLENQVNKSQWTATYTGG